MTMTVNDCTMVQNKVILRQEITHFPTSSGMSEVSERTSERSGGRERSEQSGAVRVNEQTDERVA